MRRIIAYEPERVGAFVSTILGGACWSSYQAIGLEDEGQLIAGVVFDNYNGASVCMHVAALPGKRWLTREFLWYAFYYPFEELKVRRITGLVAEGNAAARKFDEHLGFRLETRLKDADPTGDLLVYCMTKADCRFLELKHGK
ncbi:GNAT family N-acetyltransferase [Massilia endophytica]|uniref:GNAT family N-acetyltransferase n=1 Tax=Massilia endophytica TaxID=2899220 RepID=UPI001E36D67F|nr:GNAT family protein [Massilia endophytica]UGQ44973.1 GNAT family N-acetyltransferase [Massilia endophytica]